MSALAPLDPPLGRVDRRVQRSKSIENAGYATVSVGGCVAFSALFLFPALVFSPFFLVLIALCFGGLAAGRAGGSRARTLMGTPEYRRLLAFTDPMSVPQFRVRVQSGRHETRLLLEQVGPAAIGRHARVLRDRAWPVGEEDEAEALDLATEWRAEAEQMTAQAREAYIEAEVRGIEAVDFARHLADVVGDDRWREPRFVPEAPSIRRGLFED